MLVEYDDGLCFVSRQVIDERHIIQLQQFST